MTTHHNHRTMTAGNNSQTSHTISVATPQCTPAEMGQSNTAATSSAVGAQRLSSRHTVVCHRRPATHGDRVCVCVFVCARECVGYGCECVQSSTMQAPA